MSHTWDPDRYLTLRRRARPAVRRPDRRASAPTDPAHRRRPRLRPGQPHRACSPSAGRTRTSLGLDSSAGDDRAAARRPASGSRSRSPTCATGRPTGAGRRAGLQRHPAVGARPPRPAARAWCAALAPGGWLAFQVPGNFDEPSHTIRDELAASRRTPRTPRASRVPSATTRPSTSTPSPALGCAVDAWETTYLHVLTGDDPVFTWVSGTGARPTLQALPDDLRAGVRGGVQARGSRRPTRARRRTASCCRSAGSSSVAQVEPAMRLHHVQVACPPGGEDARPALLRRRARLTEVDKPADLAGARRRVVPRRDGVRRARTSASRSRSRPPARRTRPCCSTVAELEALAARLAGLGFEVDWSQRHTFPGHERFHTHDAHGNRVEVLASPWSKRRVVCLRTRYDSFSGTRPVVRRACVCRVGPGGVSRVDGTEWAIYCAFGRI